jgi:hypothetical protein
MYGFTAARLKSRTVAPDIALVSGRQVVDLQQFRGPFARHLASFPQVLAQPLSVRVARRQLQGPPLDLVLAEQYEVGRSAEWHEAVPTRDPRDLPGEAILDQCRGSRPRRPPLPGLIDDEHPA